MIRASEEQTIAEVVRASDAPLAIVVDQFEECWTMADASEREVLVGALMAQLRSEVLLSDPIVYTLDEGTVSRLRAPGGDPVRGLPGGTR